MDIKQLIYFTTIVDEGNISAAAKKTSYIPAALKQPDT